MKEVTVHTDGGCEPNPGVGGWAAVLRYGEHMRELVGGEDETTNNRMELLACISALEAIKEPCIVHLFTDSQYVKNGITSWIVKWKRNGWRLSSDKRKPVQNVDLWQRLDEAVKRHDVRWGWVRGHAGNADNERCDVLCAEEIARRRRALRR